MTFVEIGVVLILVAFAAWIVNVRMNPGAAIKTPLNVVLTLIIVGTALWLINTYIPMAGSIRAILNIVVVVATCVRVLQAFGLWGGAVRLWNSLTSHFPR